MFKINFNHLFYFMNIVEQGSIVAASEKLNLTQSAMSHQLKKLEDSLEKKLFKRTGRKLVLTEEGEQVYKYAKQIFRKSEEMIQVVKSKGSQYLNFFRLGVASSVSLSHAYRFIQPLLIVKELRIQVISGSMDDLLDKLMNSEIDVVVCDLPYSRLSPDVYAQKIRSSKIACYSNFKTASRLKEKKFPECLNKKKIITYVNDSALREQVDNFIREYEIDVQIVGEFSDISLIQHILNNSQLIGFLPVDTAENSVKLKKLKKLHEIPHSNYDVWAYYHRKSKVRGFIIKYLLPNK